MDTFVVRPHVAGGAGKAAMDAKCLVECMESQDVSAALACYEKTQHEFGTRIVQHSRYLGADLEGRPTKTRPEAHHPRLRRAEDPARHRSHSGLDPDSARSTPT